MQQIKLSEVLAMDTKTEQDIFQKAQAALLKKLAKFTTFPFVRKVDQQLRSVMADTVGAFTEDGNPDEAGNPTAPEKFSPELQIAWSNMVERLGTVIGIMVTQAVIFSIARKEPEGFPELKQKATAEFDKIAREPLMAIVQTLQQLKAAGVDIMPYKNLLQTDVRRGMVDDIFNLGAKELETLVNVIDVNPAIKIKLLGAIKDKANTYLGTARQVATTANMRKVNPAAKAQQQKAGIPQTNPDAELQGGQPPPAASAIPPQVAQTISSGFKQYMDKLKTDYGVESLRLINREIQAYLQNIEK